MVYLDMADRTDELLRPRGGIIESGALAVGIQLPIQAQSARFADGWEADAGPVELAAVARAADDAGLAYIAVCDHVAVPRAEAEVMGTTWYDAIATLGWLAAQTERVRLLSHIWVLPYRHPLVTAKAFATLDALSGGRIVLGVGAGHVVGEFEALGVEHARRGRLLDEGIDAVRAALRDEFPEHEGERWSFRDLGVAPRPVQDGGPPIWVGGSSTAAIRRAARRGDGWLPQGPPEVGMRDAVAMLLEERAAVHGEGLPIDIGANAEFVYVGDSPNDLGRAELSGDPEHIAQRLARYRRIGVNQLQISLRTRSAAETCEQLERIGAEVLPLLEEDR